MARKSKFHSGGRKERFLRVLKETTNPTLAAESIGMSLKWLNKVRKKDSVFSALWEDAIEEGLDLCEAEIKRRGFDGYDEPVYFQGLLVDTQKKYSDKLAIEYMRANRPKKYRDHVTVDTNTGGVLLVSDVKGIEEWKQENDVKEEAAD